MPNHTGTGIWGTSKIELRLLSLQSHKPNLEVRILKFALLLLTHWYEYQELRVSEANQLGLARKLISNRRVEYGELVMS